MTPRKPRKLGVRPMVRRGRIKSDEVQGARHPVIWAIAAAMLARDVSARGLARQTGLTRHQVGEILDGRRFATIPMLEAIGKALGLHLRIEMHAKVRAKQVLTIRYEGASR